MENSPPIIPQEEMQNTTQKKLWASIFIVAMFSILISYTVNQHFLLQKYIQTENNPIQQLSTIQKKLEKSEQETELCLNDRAGLLSVERKMYSPDVFGISSPLFEKKEIEISTYEYKRKQILSKIIRSNDRGVESIWTIETWEINSGRGFPDIPSLSHVVKNIDIQKSVGSSPDFPIFGGYENTMHSPTWISEIINSWRPEDAYKSAGSIQMYRRYSYEPRTIGSVYFEFFRPSSFDSKHIFVRVSASVKNYPYAQGENDPSVVEAKKELKEIVDTLKLTPAYL